MNKSILLSLALALPAMAGTSTVQTTTYEAPPQTGWQWFTGASAAYLFDYEEVLYTANVGVKSPWSPLGFATSFYLEGGFLEQDNDGESNLGLGVGNTPLDVDLKLVPITANVKFEKALNDHFGLYVGGGLGSTHSEVSSIAADLSENEWIFTAQVFAGVNYHINEHAEVYTGARWIWFDNADDYKLDDDYAAELGFRWHF